MNKKLETFFLAIIVAMSCTVLLGVVGYVIFNHNPLQVVYDMYQGLWTMKWGF